MPTLWFVLGREPLLSAAELFAKLKVAPEKATVTPLFFKTPTPADFSPSLINSLGGTVKIATELGAGLTEEALLTLCTKELEKQTGKITFGFSAYSESFPASRLEQWGKDLKRILKSTGRNVRYVFKREPILSSVTVEKNKLHTSGAEFIVEQTGNTFALAQTVAVQPFEAFGSRDYGRPGRDSESGMLPPKLALMMVNLTSCPLNKTILDPFCGSGTVLSEASLLGHTIVIGSDASEKAIADCRKNIAWLKETHPLLAEPTVSVQDVRTLSAALQPASVEAIATEPYLGKPLTGRETAATLETSTRELQELYRTAFTQFKEILTPTGTVVFIVPRFKTKTGWITISDKLMPLLDAMGFVANPLLPPALTNKPYVLYHRPGQYVGREIWRFKLKNPS